MSEQELAEGCRAGDNRARKMLMERIRNYLKSTE